ncbi:MAG: hypothetical protein AB1921_14080 [Thermodesulfobacteriota bacterium]
MDSTPGPGLLIVGGFSGSDVFVGGESVRLHHYDGSSWSPIGVWDSELRDVWGSSSSDVFAVGDDGTMLHYDGLSWTAETPVTTEDLLGLWGSSASDVFAGGSEGNIWHYNGTSWSLMGDYFYRANDFWGTSGSDVFAVGCDGNSSVNEEVLHYDGSSWSPANWEPRRDLYGFWGWGTATGWAGFAVGSNGTVLRCLGEPQTSSDGPWGVMPTGTTENLYSVCGVSGSSAYAVGANGAFLRFDGTSWVTMPSPTGNDLRGVWSHDGDPVFAVGEPGKMWSWNGTSWTFTYVPGGIMNAVWGTSDYNVYAVGDGGRIIHKDGPWYNEESGTTEDLLAVWGASYTEVYAVGKNSTALYSDGTEGCFIGCPAGIDLYDVQGGGGPGGCVHALGWDGEFSYILYLNVDSWEFEVVHSTRGVLYGLGLSGPYLVAVGADEAVWFLDPYFPYLWYEKDMRELFYGLDSVWGASGTDVFAVGSAGAIVHFDGSLSFMDSGTSSWLTGVWGSSGSDVFAVGAGGTVLHYNGSLWSPMDSGTTKTLSGVWGTSGTDVYAVGDEIILHYDGSFWNEMDAGISLDLNRVWGSSATDLFAVGQGMALVNTGIVSHLETELPPVIDLNPDLPGEKPDAVFYGANASENMSKFSAMAVGDLNGDGFGDLVLGSPGRTRSPGGPTNGGAVAVYYGKGDFGGSAPGPAPDTLIWGASAEDKLSFNGAVKVADLDADGFDDLILGAYLADGPDEDRLTGGEVYVIYGRAEHLPASMDLANSDEDATIYGAGAGDQLALSGAFHVGDVNSDGKPDLILAAPWADAKDNLKTNAGEVYILYGNGGRLPETVDLAAYASMTTIYGATAGDFLANDRNRILLGDLDADGTLDLILGSTSADGPGNSISSCGEACVVYGSNSLGAELDLETSDKALFLHGRKASDGLSGVMAVGDYNGDGADDLALGAQNADGPGDERASGGEAYIFYGGPRPALPVYVNMGTDADVTVFGAEAGDLLGGSMAAADTNGDGRDDLILGASAADYVAQGRTDCGAAYLLYGSAGLPAQLDLDSQNANVTVYGGDASDGLSGSRSVAAADLNGDGYADILLGACAADGPRNGRDGAGEAYVFYGSGSLPAVMDIAKGAADVLLYGADAADQLPGPSGGMVFGDLNGDGIEDLVLGAYNADGENNDMSAAGEAYVILGNTLSETSTVRQTDHALNPLGKDYGTSRAVLDYASGSGPSLTTVTLTRNSTGINMAGLTDVADVNWSVDTDRKAFGADVTFHYLDSEIEGLDEASLKLFKADSLGGEFSEVPGAVFDRARNRVKVEGVSDFSVFVLGIGEDAPEPEAPTAPPCFLRSLW